MATHTFELIDGLATGEGDKRAVHKTVTLRTLTAGDLEDAALEAERVIRDASDNVTIATSPVLMSNNILRRQIQQIGGIMGPLPAPLLRTLSSIDLELIQAEAELLDAAGRRSVEAALLRGRSEEPTAGV
jgi:phage FluMu protein gp41